MPKSIHELSVEIYADGADKASLLEIYRDPLVKGLTTNPTLMKVAGISDYEAFAREVLAEVSRRAPIRRTSTLTASVDSRGCWAAWRTTQRSRTRATDGGGGPS